MMYGLHTMELVGHPCRLLTIGAGVTNKHYLMSMKRKSVWGDYKFEETVANIVFSFIKTLAKYPNFSQTYHTAKTQRSGRSCSPPNPRNSDFHLVHPAASQYNKLANSKDALPCGETYGLQ